VSDAASCKRLVDFASDIFNGHIDVLALIHLSPWFQPWSNVAAKPEMEETLESSIQVNLFSYIYLASYAMPALRAAGGSILVASSAAGRMGIPYVAPYSAAKHGLHGFFESLRCVMCVCVCVCVCVCLCVCLCL
jgi:dehydrogenase/reductase SDR family member 7